MKKDGNMTVPVFATIWTHLHDSFALTAISLSAFDNSNTSFIQASGLVDNAENEHNIDNMSWKF